MKSIVLFDGECNVCDASVQFILKHDAQGYFQFASLQSEIGQSLLKQYDIPPATNSLVLIDQGKAYIQSTAALKIAKNLDGLWKWCYGAMLIPPAIRNRAYNILANNRYKWFGKKEACLLPTNEQRKRFL
ncbi:thiol-disulfide oxidoreductase [Solibacillus sp. R5-41]|uniref:thiol-disulfide oxidoreductase DCC family protein n=1 Tax=Solibacillus sp. R5-41 TaxID=2048654 RepID=UPI000C12533D|nr:thiol-disulfide oxidoreductase DCC family protein [Solibacillus sp. R5-41]ATP41261.1 thiol-disulfide oxidoreductase [Solibacillus sp. R5-41]